MATGDITDLSVLSGGNQVTVLLEGMAAASVTGIEGGQEVRVIWRKESGAYVARDATFVSSVVSGSDALVTLSTTRKIYSNAAMVCLRADAGAFDDGANTSAAARYLLGTNSSTQTEPTMPTPWADWQLNDPANLGLDGSGNARHGTVEGAAVASRTDDAHDVVADMVGGDADCLNFDTHAAALRALGGAGSTGGTFGIGLRSPSNAALDVAFCLTSDDDDDTMYYAIHGGGDATFVHKIGDAVETQITRSPGIEDDDLRYRLAHRVDPAAGHSFMLDGAFDDANWNATTGAKTDTAYFGDLPANATMCRAGKFTDLRPLPWIGNFSRIVIYAEVLNDDQLYELDDMLQPEGDVFGLGGQSNMVGHDDGSATVRRLHHLLGTRTSRMRSTRPKATGPMAATAGGTTTTGSSRPGSIQPTAALRDRTTGRSHGDKSTRSASPPLPA